MHSTDTQLAELTIADALSVAVQLHRAGRIAEAEELYLRILEAEPQQPDALSFLGIVTMHRGRLTEAVDLLRRSIAIDPRADRYNNLGNVLLASERIDEAVEAYDRAIGLEPLHADAHCNLGIIYRAQGKFEAAARAYARAIEINPKHVETYNNYGNLMSACGRMSEAIQAYSKALTLRPHDGDAKKYMALAHASLGDYAAAAAIYREWLEHEPDHPGVRHLLAACSGENVPERASDAYVESTFDSFSRRFDAQLAKLEYRAPELVAAALRRAAGAAERRLVALDAGCGTGLCGPLLGAYVSHLTGVDISAGMLEKARVRGVYDALVKSELTRYLAGRKSEFDLVVSADTLVYFGRLDEVAHAAAGALKPGGLLIFTVEKAAEPDAPGGYRLNHHGRYSHTRDYVTGTLCGAGFDAPVIDEGVLRQERGEPVQGLIVTARLSAGAATLRPAHSEYGGS